MRGLSEGNQVYCTVSSGHIDFKPEDKNKMMTLVSALLDSGADVCICQDCEGVYMVDYLSRDDQQDGILFETVTDMRR